MRFIVLAVMDLALQALLWDRFVAYKDRENFEGNRKPSVLAFMKPCLTLLKARRNRQWKNGREQCVQLLCDTGELAEGYQWKKEDHGIRALYYEGRRLLKSSAVNKVVVEEFERTKGSGAGKLVCSVRENFLGVSRAKIQTILKHGQKSLSPKC